MHSSALLQPCYPEGFVPTGAAQQRFPNSSNPETEKSHSHLQLPALSGAKQHLSMETLRHVQERRRNTVVHSWKAALLDVPGLGCCSVVDVEAKLTQLVVPAFSPQDGCGGGC